MPRTSEESQQLNYAINSVQVNPEHGLKKMGGIDVKTNDGEQGLYITLSNPMIVYPFAEDKFGKTKAVIAITDTQDLNYLNRFSKSVVQQVGKFGWDVEMTPLLFENRDSLACMRLTIPKARGSEHDLVDLKLLKFDGTQEPINGQRVLDLMEANMNQIKKIGVWIRAWYRQEDDGKIKAGFYCHVDLVSV